MTTPNPENTQKSVSARRRLLHILAVGGTAAVVLPEKWVKPVVDAVIVPAHAAGSVVRAQGVFGNQGPLFVVSNFTNPLERFADMLIGSAYAQSPVTCGAENTLCISFSIPAPANTQVTVNVNGSTTTTQISANNSLLDVTIDNLVFSNLIVSSTTLSGFVTSTRGDCASGPMTLPRRTGNFCSTDT